MGSNNLPFDSYSEVFFPSGGSGSGADPYKVQYVDTASLTIPSATPYTPDGTPVITGDKVLFTNLTTRTGLTGRGCYQAAVVGGVITWTKLIFGQDTVVGNSMAGDEVMSVEGVTYYLHTFICTDTAAAIWQDNGTPNSIAIKEEGTLVDADVDTIDFVGNNVTATQTAPGKVQVAVGGVLSVTGSNVDNADPLNPVIDTIVVDGTTITGTGTTGDPLVGAPAGVLSVSGANVDNTDPVNPVIDNIVVDGVTITGTGTLGDPLISPADGVQSVTGWNVGGTATDPMIGGPVVDGTTITGTGVIGDPLIATAASEDHLVVADALDTTADYLDNKINIHSSDASVSVTHSITNPGGNEVIDVDLTVTPSIAKYSANFNNTSDWTSDQRYGEYVGTPSGCPTAVTIDALSPGVVGNITLIANGTFAAFSGSINVLGVPTLTKIAATYAGALSNTGVAFTGDAATDLATFISTWNLTNAPLQLVLTSGNGTDVPDFGENFNTIGGSGDDITTLITNWNGSHGPTEQITLSSGDGTQVPSADVKLLGGIDGTTYTITVPALTHGAGLYPIVQVSEITGPMTCKNINVDISTDIASGDVTIGVDQVPDGRFLGRYIIC